MRLKLPFLRKKERRQRLLILTEDRRIVPATLPVIRGYIQDDRIREAYLLDPAALVKDKEKGEAVEVVTERSAIPLYLSSSNGLWAEKQKLLNQEIKGIAKEALEQELATIPERAAKDKFAEAIKFLLLVLGITAALVAVVALLASGQLHFTLPSFGW